MIRVPTTVLAQNDAGVGVKNGINLFGKKNFLGTFSPPFAVLNDIDFIDTLDRRDVVSGCAEAVKVALIRDRSFFDYLEVAALGVSQADRDVLAHLIRQYAELHLNHICTAGDPFELGSRRPLDFGHWAAHKLESMTHNRLRHGEAVAIGIALDSVYAMKAGYLGVAALDRILAVLTRLGFTLWDDDLLTRGPRGRFSVLDGLDEFREHLGGDLHVTLSGTSGKGSRSRTSTNS